MKLIFFRKNWKPVFCFFGGLREISAATALIDFDNKKIKIKKYFYYFNNSEEGFGEEDFIKILSRLLKKVSKKTPVIICFEQPFTKSSKVRLSVVRENPLSPLEYEDLENIILNLAWRIYDKERIFVSQKMKISEWDVALANSKITEPRVDDKKVLNPLGFTCKTLSFYLENTYFHALFWDAIKTTLEQWGGELLFLGEKNLLFDKIFSLINNTEPAVSVEIGYSSTGIGILSDYLNSFKYFDWGEKNLLRSISQNLSTSFDVAQEIKKIYEKGDMGENAKNWFKKLFEKEWKLLIEGVILATKDFSVDKKIKKIYFFGFLKKFPLLIEAFQKQKWPTAIFSNPVSISFYSNEQFLNDTEIDLEQPANEISFNLLLTLSYPFLADSKYEEMNKILKRRIKWLNQNILKHHK